MANQFKLSYEILSHESFNGNIDYAVIESQSDIGP